MTRRFLWTALVVVCAVAASAAQPAAPLRIVVIEGEDAVNVIQQKTAVAPVIEVRDRNDQPVSGAVVRFVVSKGRATFNGSRTLTVTTDAAGRATGIGLTPSGAGPLQITANASYQRLNAVATISQTNVAAIGGAAAAAGAVGAGTAAGTAAAGGTAAGGAAAAAGGAAAAAGGLGAGTIAAIAAGAGGGALLVAKETGVVGGGSRKPCQFSVSPTSFVIAGNGSRNVGPEPSVAIGLADDNCEPIEWTATSNAPFVTFRDFTGAEGLSSTSGKGASTFFFQVAANDLGGGARTGSFSVAGQTVTINQNGRCLYQLSPGFLTFPHDGGTLPLTVTITPAGCDTDTWTATTISNFITLNPAAGKGTGTINVTASGNFPTFPGGGTAPRSGNINVIPPNNTGSFIIQFAQP